MKRRIEELKGILKNMRDQYASFQQYHDFTETSLGEFNVQLNNLDAQIKEMEKILNGEAPLQGPHPTN